MIDKLLDPEVQKFIHDNESVDPFELSIKHQSFKGIPFKFIAEQMISRKLAKSKLPEWYEANGIVYPPKLSMEQCSSDLAASYKASLVKGNSFIDLTGGMGVDTLAFSKHFKSGHYVERNPDLAELAHHNLTALGASNLTFENKEAGTFLASVQQPVDFIYIDPARRGTKDEKVFHFSDCEPNIIELQPLLLEKSNKIMVKASPMLDIDLSIKSLAGIYEVHIVSINNECKEVLYVLDCEQHDKVKIVTVNFRATVAESFAFYKEEEQNAKVTFSPPLRFLYEPNTSILKAGAFKVIGEHFNIKKLHRHAHLYTSETLVENFPGRVFEIEQAIPYNKKLVKKLIPEGKANITTRNFKEEVSQIRKKTGLKDGGSKYLFATTGMDDKPMIIITKKVRENE
ncbi:MAG TPA: RsmD family RNA methyltransferase [Fulvivirga sp.]|nr:RsmD family RNA methyltransferase [Fulvivirga sp.]